MTASTDLHRVPEGSTIVAPGMCSNCSRRLYVVSGDKVLCIACSNGLHIGAQVWVCFARGKRGMCGTSRKYGDGPPADKSSKRLLCDRCHDVTRHEFFEVSRGCA